jgi:hypothetical protein
VLVKILKSGLNVFRELERNVRIRLSIGFHNQPQGAELQIQYWRPLSTRTLEAVLINPIDGPTRDSLLEAPHEDLKHNGHSDHECESGSIESAERAKNACDIQ